MYAQNCTKSDIRFLSEYCAAIKVIHDWIREKLQRKFSETCKEWNHILSCRKFDHLEVIGCSDSNFAICDAKRKLQLALCSFLHERRFHGSVNQFVIAASTLEAEFMAHSEAAIHRLWLRTLFHNMRLSTVLSGCWKFTW